MLDADIEALRRRICEVRGVENFTDEDIETEYKAWRELLHEYNDTKDACLYIFGQLSHLKMITVRQLFEKYGINDES